MYIFPGLGLGTIVSKARLVSDGMIFAAAQGLANALTTTDIEEDAIYPSLDRIRDVSIHVAKAVCEQAIKENLATDHTLLTLAQHNTSSTFDQSLLEYIKNRMWDVNQDRYFEISV